MDPGGGGAEQELDTSGAPGNAGTAGTVNTLVVVEAELDIIQVQPSNSINAGAGGSWYSNNKVQISIIMTSKIKVDNINKVSDDSNIIKKCGTTTTIGSGASNPIVVDGSAVTLGRCGGTVALASVVQHRQGLVEQEQ